MIDAWHLPGHAEPRALEVREYDGVRIRFARLEPPELHRVMHRLRGARRDILLQATVGRIVDAIDRAALRFLEPGDPFRIAALTALPAVTGYSAPMVELILDRMAADWRAPSLERLLRAELPDPAALDRFVTAPDGRCVRALGPELTFHIFSGNVPGVAVTSLIRALLVKSASVGKTAAGEPVLPALFAQALATVAPDLNDALAVTYWPGGDDALESIAYAEADTVVVYGGVEVVANARRRAAAGAQVVVHGPKMSLAVIGREALAETRIATTARDLAVAMSTFDQQGCVSPHFAMVQVGGEVGPNELAARLAVELERIDSELPRGRIDAGEAAAIHSIRTAAEMKELAGGDVRLHASKGTSYTVVYDPQAEPGPSCLNRVLAVIPVGELEEAARRIAPLGPLLQSVGLAGAGDRRDTVAEQLARAGATRITTLRDLPWPASSANHDGHGPLRELLRFVDLEAAG